MICYLVDFLVILICYSPGPDITNSNGSSSLALATLYGHTEIVEHLLNEGFNVNLRDEGYRTALHYAVLGNQIEMTKLLISKGAIVDTIGDILDENKSTPLHLAVRLGDSEVSVKMSHYYIPSIRAHTMREGPHSLIWGVFSY